MAIAARTPKETSHYHTFGPAARAASTVCTRAARQLTNVLAYLGFRILTLIIGDPTARAQNGGAVGREDVQFGQGAGWIGAEGRQLMADDDRCLWRTSCGRGLAGDIRIRGVHRCEGRARSASAGKRHSGVVEGRRLAIVTSTRAVIARHSTRN